ncbi:MAG: hypothetical protein WKF59_21960 [Chitinophagaceae bacterium]
MCFFIPSTEKLNEQRRESTCREDRFPGEEPQQEQPVNKVAKADAVADEITASAEPIAETEQAAINNLQTENRYGSTSSYSPSSWKENMERLFLGIFNVIPCCVLRFFSGVPIGTQN